jgi:hypothetical protein
LLCTICHYLSTETARNGEKEEGLVGFGEVQVDVCLDFIFLLDVVDEGEC